MFTLARSTRVFAWSLSFLCSIFTLRSLREGVGVGVGLSGENIWVQGEAGESPGKSKTVVSGGPFR